MELRWSSRQTVERWRPMERAISDWLQPCLLSAASIYLSPEVSWWYVMANILFVVVENLRQYRRSPPAGGSVLHLVYESAKPNNGMHPTADTLPVIHLQRCGRAGDAGR